MSVENGLAPTLKTQRLHLRPHTRADFELMVALYASDRSKYIGGPKDRKAVWLNFMAGIGQWSLDGYGAWAIERLADGQTVGQVAVSKPPNFPELELGWTLFEDFEKQGYALEAASMAKKFAIETLKTDTLVSYIDPENLSSQRLAIKLGARRDYEAQAPDNNPAWVFRYQCGEAE